jgi:hypothetical protein
METCVRKHVSTRGVAGLEVEFRLGSRVGGKFRPGVSRSAFEAVKSSLAASDAFAPAPQTVTVDYYFENRKGRLGDDGSWTAKDVLAVDDSARDVRGAVAVETVHVAPQGVSSKNSAFFRKKMRDSFAWKVLPWKIDMTRVESNDDPDAEDERYEIEVEMDPSVLYYAPLEHIIQHGRSIASDLAAIAGKCAQ